MKLDNLEVDKTYKNYKELCEVLEISSASGGTKKKNLEVLNSCVCYSMKGRSFTIHKILNTNPIVIDKRGLNSNSHNNQNGAYGKYIRLLILNMLSQGEEDLKSKGNIILSGKNEMLETLNMINNNYRYGSYNRKAMSHYLGIDIELLDEFYGTNTRKMRKSVETTLNKLMKSEKLIFWTTVKMVGIGYKQREATNEEIEFIVEAEKQALKDMGTNKMEYVYATDKLAEFYLKVNMELKKNNINFTYDAYKIIFSDYVYEDNKQLEYKLELEIENLNKTELNTTVYDNLLESIKSRNKKVNEDKYKMFPNGEVSQEWLYQNKGYKKTVLRNDFVKIGRELMDICVDETYEDICEKIGSMWMEYNRRIFDDML